MSRQVHVSRGGVQREANNMHNEHNHISFFQMFWRIVFVNFHINHQLLLASFNHL